MTKRTPEQKVYQVLTADTDWGYPDMELEESTKEELEELKTLTQEAMELEREKREFIRDIEEQLWKVRNKYVFLTSGLNNMCDEESCLTEEYTLSEEAEEYLLKHFLRKINEELTLRIPGEFKSIAEQRREAEEQRIRRERANRLPRYVITSIYDDGILYDFGYGIDAGYPFEVEYWETEEDVPNEELLNVFCIKGCAVHYIPDTPKGLQNMEAFHSIEHFFEEYGHGKYDDLLIQKFAEAKARHAALAKNKK